MNRFIECVGVGKTYPGKSEPVEALRGIDFTCQSGDFVCLLGRSGCGKSTLLMMLAGLELPTSGQIAVAGRELDGPSPDAAIVFQDHGLFPWMTVQKNVEFNMKARGTPASARKETATKFIEMTGLGGFEGRYPHELSGGMRQRVGIARALTTGPKALMMDEPFGALDAQTRGKLQDELLQIWEKQKTTVLFVTHSIDEALLLADRILVFTPRPGRIAADIKVDLPRPRTSQSAGFISLARELRGLIGADRDFD
ncbi:MAG: ABC transporter ATP-binding protein [Alphaproteobacteria bacterium]|nr:ABC transporter ATP-binding protein [Alphaproteobacteria bacterium]